MDKGILLWYGLIMHLCDSKNASITIGKQASIHHAKNVANKKIKSGSML